VEIVALDVSRHAGCLLLQHRVGVRDPDAVLLRRAPVVLCVFEVLHLDDRETIIAS
jgi:hypothetical protein